MDALVVILVVVAKALAVVALLRGRQVSRAECRREMVAGAIDSMRQ